MAFAIDDLDNVLAHWDAGAITGLSDGDAVSTLPDSKGGWDLTGTSTTRPVYRPTSGINSLPAIEFDGSDDYLVSTSKVFSGVNSPRCIVILRLDTLKNYNSSFCLTTSTASPPNSTSTTRLQGGRYYSTGYIVGQCYKTGTAQLQTAASVISATTTYMVRSDLSDLARGIVVNGAIPIMGASSGTLNGADINTTMYAHFGRENLAGAFFDGLVAEIVLWDESLLCESMYIEGVLAAKYGITLPATHPFYSGAPSSGPSSGGTSGGSLINSQQLVRQGWIG